LEERGAMSRRRVLRFTGWLAAAGLLALSAVLDPSVPAQRSSSVALRLLGPVAELAARVQWVRARASMVAGRTDLALARGEVAIELDPGDTSGWTDLAWHLALERGSLQRERDPVRRLAWIRAGLDLARRGEERAREPGELALWQGLVLVQLAREDEPPDWPGGVAGLWADAAEHFERAARLGQRDGAELARGARARISG
jgi:hypothetical protein